MDHVITMGADGITRQFKVDRNGRYALDKLKELQALTASLEDSAKNSPAANRQNAIFMVTGCQKHALERLQKAIEVESQDGAAIASPYWRDAELGRSMHKGMVTFACDTFGLEYPWAP